MDSHYMLIYIAFSITIDLPLTRYTNGCKQTHERKKDKEARTRQKSEFSRCFQAILGLCPVHFEHFLVQSKQIRDKIYADQPRLGKALLLYFGIISSGKI